MTRHRWDRIKRSVSRTVTTMFSIFLTIIGLVGFVLVICVFYLSIALALTPITERTHIVTGESGVYVTTTFTCDGITGDNVLGHSDLVYNFESGEWSTTVVNTDNKCGLRNQEFISTYINDFNLSYTSTVPISDKNKTEGR